MLSHEDAVIVSAYTGVLACKFSDMHEYVEKKMGRPVWTHEFASASFMDELRDACRDDFLAILPKEADHADSE